MLSFEAMRLDATTISIVALVVGATAAVFTLFGQERHRPRLLYIGVFLTIGTAFLQAFVAILASKESTVFQADIRGLNVKSLQKSENIEALQAQLIQRADSVSQLNQALANKSDQLARFVSGGDSFARVEVIPNDETILFKVRQVGRYPMYDYAPGESVEVIEVLAEQAGAFRAGRSVLKHSRRPYRKAFLVAQRSSQ
jgi:hypothetical protein